MIKCQDSRFVNVGGKLYDLSGHNVMAIINVTPDSFFKGSRVSSFDSMLAKIENDIALGATIFDIGGYSSRPGAVDVSVKEEVRRVADAVEVIRDKFPDILLSIDTFRSEVIEQVVHSFGAVIVNDITAGEADPKIIDVAAKYSLPYIAMHMRGSPRDMQTKCDYTDVTEDVIDYFHKRIEFFKRKGVETTIIDPGFGFSKNIAQNFEMMRNLNRFKVFNNMLLVGISRKSMIWKTLDITPDEALNGTTALNMVALTAGADILRVHDVRQAVECVGLFEKIYPYVQK